MRYQMRYWGGKDVMMYAASDKEAVDLCMAFLLDDPREARVVVRRDSGLPELYMPVIAELHCYFDLVSDGWEVHAMPTGSYRETTAPPSPPVTFPTERVLRFRKRPDAG